MKRISFLKKALMVGCLTVLAATTAMAGISGTFVKADATNTTSEADAFDWNSTAAQGYDNKWGVETWGGFTALTSHPRFIDDNGWTGENAPSITTVVKGLDVTKTYDVYVQILTHPQGFWGAYANLNWAPNTFLDKNNTTPTGLMWGDGPIAEYKLGTISNAGSFAVNVDDYYDTQNYSISSYYGVSYVDVTPTVPEPSSLLALGSALCAIAGVSKRFKK